MNCERFQTVATGLARNQMMDADERASAQAHVDECDDCGRAWSDQVELSERLRSVADGMRASRAPEHIEAQVLAAFRDRTSVVSIAPKRWRYWMSAAAAVVLMVFGLLAWRSRVASLRPPPVQASSNSATGPLTVSPKQPQSQTVEVTTTPSSPRLLKPVVRKSLSRRHPAPSQLAKSDVKQSTVAQVVPATNLEVKELSTEFVTVGYGNALDLQDGGQLVRVELPRSALARFGLPMNMDRADERIKADVLVGTDGLARAIRFVETKAINKD